MYNMLHALTSCSRCQVLKPLEAIYLSYRRNNCFLYVSKTIYYNRKWLLVVGIVAASINEKLMMGMCGIYFSHFRDFRLHLSPHKELFASDFVAYHVDRHGNKILHKVDKNRFYYGHVLGE